MPEAHHYRIRVTRLDAGGVEAEADPLHGGIPLAVLADRDGGVAWLEDVLRWAEALPWPGMPCRSASYREDIFVERRDTGGQHGYRLEAINRHREDHTDSRFLPDEMLGDPEALRDALQWAESLGTLT